MSTHKWIDRICVAAAVLAMVIAVVFMNGEKLGLEKLVNEDRETYEATEYFTSNDLNSAEIDFADAVKVTLTDEKVSIDGNGAYVLNDTVRIVKSGYYSVSGSTDRYQIVVDAEDYSKVWIELNGVTVTCSDDACLQVEKADKVFLVLAEGAENIFESGSEYSESAVENGHDGAIFSREDLTITGSGTLKVTAGYQHGIVSNDDLVITGGDITVDAAADGLHANDSVKIANANLTVKAGDEGIQADEENCILYVESGALSITSEEDALKSAGDITVKGGNITINAGDDGIRSETAVYIHDGTITINQCYEGIEAVAVEIYGGDITIYPEDDGINANGGSGDFFGGGFGPQMGSEQNGHEQPSVTEEGEQPSFDPGNMPAEMPENSTDTEDMASSVSETEESEESADTYILIAGGKITIVSETAVDADGLDSNGDVIITGGEIHVSLTGGGTNNAIDYGSESGGTAMISGGTLVASGSYNMAESFDSSSEQVSIMYNISSGAEAGTEVTVTAEDGTVVMQETIPCSFTSIILSCPQLTVGGTYTISFDDMEETITIEEVSASYGDAQSSMFGGTMNFGGMQRRGEGNSFPSMNEDGSFPEPPADGERPTPPDMGENGGMPDFSEIPSGFPQGENADADSNRPSMNEGENRHDFREEQGTSEESDETETENGQMQEPSGAPDSAMSEMRPSGERPEAEDSNSEAETAAEETSSSEAALVLTGASILILLSGILFAKFSKGRHISA